jgi:hypothetical protein
MSLVAVAAAVAEDVERAGVAVFQIPRRGDVGVRLVEEDAALVGLAGVVDPVEDEVGARETGWSTATVSGGDT